MTVEVRLLGTFEVRVDGAPVPSSAWTHARARDLVKLLALAPRHRLPRERVVEDLWPQLDADAGFANLHKAAHHARRAIGHADAVVLREGQVMLAPAARAQTDAERFEQTGDPDLYTGDLLPDDRYAAWTQEPRTRLRELYLEPLRVAARWEQLADEEPAEEPAQRAVMRARLAAGDRPGALRAFERLRAALEPLGLRPSIDTVALHGRIAGGAALGAALTAVELALGEAPLAERAQLLARSRPRRSRARDSARPPSRAAKRRVARRCSPTRSSSPAGRRSAATSSRSRTRPCCGRSTTPCSGSSDSTTPKRTCAARTSSARTAGCRSTSPRRSPPPAPARPTARRDSSPSPRYRPACGRAGHGPPPSTRPAASSP